MCLILITQIPESVQCLVQERQMGIVIPSTARINQKLPQRLVRQLVRQQTQERKTTARRNATSRQLRQQI